MGSMDARTPPRASGDADVRLNWALIPQAFGLENRPVEADPLEVVEHVCEEWKDWALLEAVFPNFKRLQALAAMPYREYLQTDEWRDRRNVMAATMGGKCERCGSPRRLHVHHKTYARRGYELMSDLEVLCAPCHKAEHGIA